jgi:hypothetical protein
MWLLFILKGNSGQRICIVQFPAVPRSEVCASPIMKLFVLPAIALTTARATMRDSLRFSNAGELQQIIERSQV